HGLDPDAALQLIDRLLGERIPQAIVADVDWSRLRPILEARRPRPLLGDLGQELAAQRSGQPSQNGGTSGAAWAVALREVAHTDRRVLALEMLESKLGTLLRSEYPPAISRDSSLYGIGLRSLPEAEFVTR